MSLPVKVCGITRLEDAREALRLGAQAIGFIFYPPSPRAIQPEAAKAIVRALPPFTITVGVFVGFPAEQINAIADHCGLDRIQLHGGEPWDLVSRLNRPAYRAFRLRDETDLERVRAEPDQTILLDTFDTAEYGGTGKTFDWDWARALSSERQVILAGGLKPENIRDALEKAQPAAVDVSSGVEDAPGIKNHEKLNAFFEALKGHPFQQPSPWSADYASAN